MNRRAYPLDRHESAPINREKIEPPTMRPQEIHTFKSAGYQVLLHHRGVVIDRLSGFIDSGRDSAIADAEERAKELRIEAGDALAVSVVLREQEYQRTYVGMGTNPRAAFRDEPGLIPFYEGYPRNHRTTHAEVVWSTMEGFAPHQPIPSFLWESRFIQGD